MRARHPLSPALKSIVPPALLLVVGVCAARIATAAPVLGFRESFPGTSTAGWGGGSGGSSVVISNPGTGGMQGAGDGYLLLTTPTSSSLGTRSLGASYVGDWTAAGITQIRLWLDDVGTDDPLEMHLAIGNGDQLSANPNFWTYDIGFLPPLHAWGEYVVDLTSSASWTQILGSGSFAAALQNVDRVHIRHDLPPFLPIPEPPDPIKGDVGIDNILLTNGLVGVSPAARAAVRPVDLAAPFPNPSRGPVALTFQTFDGGAVRAQVVDAAGRSVRRVELGRLGPGPHAWIWDGLDDAGRRAPPGVYRARVFSPSGGTSRALARVN